MKHALRLLMASAVIGLTSFTPVQAKTLRWAYVGDVNSMDPYSLTESFSIAFLNHIYEGLVRYNEKLEIEPALATSWKYTAPDVVRFTLRKGVKFHDGADFTADDVVISMNRAIHPDSPLRSNLTTVTGITKVDDYTVDVKLTGPTPLIYNFLTNVVIFDKGWLESNDTVDPVDSTKGQESYATTHSNGTGPFVLESRRPDAKTVLVVNPAWWDTPKHNLTRIEFTPIASDATRVAALLSGELDFISPSPLQDAKRIAASPGVKVLEGPGLRTIFFGFNMREKLNDTDLASGNPFQDARVRNAFAKAINLPLLKKKIMRGKSRLAGLLVAPEVPGFDPARNEHVAHDPEGAKKLLAAAGYADGFSFAMNCPNDRYVNDEEICQAVASMISKVGLRANLTTETKGQHFSKARKNQTDVYMLGWATLPMLDAYSVLSAILHSPGDKLGTWNPGNYHNARVDEITGLIANMVDEEKRRALMREAMGIVRDEMAAVPLHQQPLSWAVRDGVDMVQSPDDKIRLWYTRKN
jgi:peptide/nickel transport system substrate-binding protein